MLPITALFHVQMNFLNTINWTNFEAERRTQDSHHCIDNDIEFWNRSKPTPTGANYHLFQPPVTQSFNPRVLAIFYAISEERNVLSGHGPLADEQDNSMVIDNILRMLTPELYLKVVD